MNDRNYIPNWVIKGKKIKLPDGNIVTFGGKNQEDVCIIVKDPEDHIHANFVIKSDEIELHLRDEKTKNITSLFEVYSTVITDLSHYWYKKEPNLVKWFKPKNWSRDVFVIDVNSKDVPNYRLIDGIYDINPDDVKPNALSNEAIIKLKFSAGIMFDKFGRCQGLLMSLKKKKILLLIEKPIFENILNTIIGMDTMKQNIKDEYLKYKNNS